MKLLNCFYRLTTLVRHSAKCILPSHSSVTNSYRTMSEITDCQILQPPECVRGMTNLNKDMFRITITVPCLSVNVSKIQVASKMLHSFMMTMSKFQCVRENPHNSDVKDILLNPTMIRSWNDLEKTVDAERFCNLNVSKVDFNFKDFDITYDNWNHEQILKSVLPHNLSFSNFSIIGHIVHLNLRENLLPYRFLIGEVLLEKNRNISLVVNKMLNIANKYRNFDMEILAGTGGTNTTVRENGCWFELDFANVYWNPRLCTEHERIIKMLQKHDYVFDVFAGIGPFAVPAGKKKCKVFANDLNPEAVHWLKRNVQKNKTTSYVQTYNMDGKDFILNFMKSELNSVWDEIAELKTEISSVSPSIHILMNLPAIAIEFLPHFRGLLNEFPVHERFVSPVVHCYCFVKDKDYADSLLQQLCTSFDKEFRKDEVSFFNVRSVAPNKDMIRITFKLERDVLYSTQSLKRCMTSDNTNVKRLCTRTHDLE